MFPKKSFFPFRLFFSFCLLSLATTLRKSANTHSALLPCDDTVQQTPPISSWTCHTLQKGRFISPLDRSIWTGIQLSCLTSVHCKTTSLKDDLKREMWAAPEEDNAPKIRVSQYGCLRMWKRWNENESGRGRGRRGCESSLSKINGCFKQEQYSSVVSLHGVCVCVCLQQL